MKLQALVPLSAAAFAALALGLVGAAPAAPAAGVTPESRLTFSDPAADAAAAPDLKNVSVVGDARTGMLVVSVTASGARPASPDGLTRWLQVWLDTDSNPVTGDDGSEYTLVYSDDPADPEHWWNVGRWDGGAWQSVEYVPTMDFTRSGDVLTWRLNKAQLGGATRFTLMAGAGIDDANGMSLGRDLAPDNGEWIYNIAGPARMLTQFVTPLIGRVATVPARVQAGQRVTVSVPVARERSEKFLPLTRGTMSCDPSVSGRRIAHAESFKNGIARLSFVVPKTAKGKVLKVTLTIKASSYRGEDGTFLDVANGRFGLVGTSYEGGSATKVFSFPVR